MATASQAPASAKTPSTEPSSPNSLRMQRIRGGMVGVISALIAFVVMASESPVVGGVYIATLGILGAALGTLDAFGFLRAKLQSDADLEQATSIRSTSLFALPGERTFFAPKVALPAALGVLIVLGTALGADALPWIIVLSLLMLLPAALRRPGLLVFVVGSLILLPFLGAYGLWDPWETHYGEVAREILSRDDWISLWWAHEDWFMSKPIFIFWSEALSMKLFGVDFHPDAHPLHPEWAMRLPHYTLAISAVVAVFALVRRSFGNKSGVLAALAVCTAPHFFMLSHQAITDMPFVSNMTLAICMLGFALTHREDELSVQYRIGRFVWSMKNTVLTLLISASLPQALYLISRNVTVSGAGFHIHRDSYLFGSAGNAGNPGNGAARSVDPVFNAIVEQPFVQGLLWALGLSLIVWFIAKEKRVRGLYMFAFYFFCAFAFMAKGIPGFALPGLVAACYLAASKRWDLLFKGQLKVAIGVVQILVVGMPWFVAMYIRHGRPFIDRLLIHDHINRLTTGVHGDNGSVKYFIEQLGTGLFPWIAFAPFALVIWLEAIRSARATSVAAGPRPAVDGASQFIAENRAAVLSIFGLWGTSGFVLFSAMTTKFHHYIFPVVVPSAVLGGIVFARLWPDAKAKDSTNNEGSSSINLRGEFLGGLFALLSALALIVGIASLYGNLRGIVPEGIHGEAARSWVIDHSQWSKSVSYAIAFAGLALALISKYFLDGTISFKKTTVAASLFVLPTLLAFAGRDLAWANDARPWGFERLIHLFVYMYERPWPEQFDYRPILTGFAVVATLMTALFAFSSLRAYATRAFLSVAVLFAVWSLDVYIVDLSPHWSQRDIIFRYYDTREGVEPLLAWQMNWKGENFYTGNRTYTFVDLDNRKLQDWMRQHPTERIFFVLEHSRVASLRSQLQTARATDIQEVTDMRMNNHFVIVSARLPAASAAPAPATRPVPAEANPAASTSPPANL